MGIRIPPKPPTTPLVPPVDPTKPVPRDPPKKQPDEQPKPEPGKPNLPTRAAARLTVDCEIRVAYMPANVISLQQGASVEVDGVTFAVLFSKTGLLVKSFSYDGYVEIDLGNVMERAIEFLKQNGTKSDNGGGL